MKQPLCRYCGGKIAKRTETTMLRVPDPSRTMFTGYTDVAAYPATKAEAQKLTNKQIVSVKRTLDKTGIDQFNTWDGESYVSEYFCNGIHAQYFAHVMAREGHATVSFVKARDKQRDAA